MTTTTTDIPPVPDYARTVEFTRGLVEAILGDHPKLHYWGFGPDPDIRCRTGNTDDAGNGDTIFDAHHALMGDESIDTIHAGLVWTRKQVLRFRTATDETVPTTTWFSDLLERATGRPVSNGQAAVVAIAADLPVECCDARPAAHSCGGGKYDAGIRLTKRSWQALDKATTGLVPEEIPLPPEPAWDDYGDAA